ncbi:DUF6602 domain-containing protein [Ralstonia sp. Ralssp110]|uniref:DUF6602 domain-containing protein n=1 Tax=Ralstonia sp. Ralssp110 TaxID=3243004 RepID=UPI0039B642DD
MATGMLDAHMSAIENALLQNSRIPANAGHTLHRGTPRENLIATFLSSHLSANVAIGTGEVIDHRSKPREQRNQYDIVIYRRNYPKLDFGGVSGFLVESVVATIEVKSLLDYGALRDAMSAAANLKRLEPNYGRSASFGWFPPKPLSFAIAYSGPASMGTVGDWIEKARTELDIAPDKWEHENRLKSAGTSLDGISVLGRGVHYLCNTPLFGDQIDPRAKCFFCDCDSGALLLFFLALQQACMGTESAHLVTQPYLAGHSFNGSFGV